MIWSRNKHNLSFISYSWVSLFSFFRQDDVEWEATIVGLYKFFFFSHCTDLNPWKWHFVWEIRKIFSLLQIVQLCLKVPYLLQDIYFTRQKRSLLFYFILFWKVFWLFIKLQSEVEGVDQDHVDVVLVCPSLLIALCSVSFLFFGLKLRVELLSQK